MSAGGRTFARTARTSTLALLVLSLLSGCYVSQDVDGAFLCDAGGGCGEGYTCDDGICCRPGGEPHCPTLVENGETCSTGEAPKRYFLDRDGDGFGLEDPPLYLCAAPVTTPVADQAGDCNDDPEQGGALFFPRAVEQCDNQDNDCDGQTDEEPCCPRYWRDQDSDGYGDPGLAPAASCSGAPEGYVANDEDCAPGISAVHPGAPELCNGRDDDCDGVLDDGLTLRDWFADGDADGYGAGAALVACYPPKGYVSNGRDCDDGSVLFSPAARDVCDGQDNDCDGVPDGQPGCGGPASLLDRVPGLSVGAQDLNAKYTAAMLGACLRGTPGATSETLAPPHWAGLSPDVNGIENAHLAYFQTDRPWDLSPTTSALSLTFSLSGTSFVSPQMWDVSSFPQPAVVLCDSSGNAKLYLPTKNRLPQPAVSTLLTTIDLPLGPSAEWTTRTSGAFDPSRVEHLELIVQPLKGEFSYDVTFNFAFSALGFSAP